MLLLLMGIAKVGKTQLANELGSRYDAVVASTDQLRREWGFHEPHRGYDTEIAPDNRPRFYHQLIDFIKSLNYPRVIIEGNALHPDDVYYFDHSIPLILGNNLSVEEKLNRAQHFADEDNWINNRKDDYLVHLFQFYKSVEDRWRTNYPECFIDLTDFDAGRQAIIQRLDPVFRLEQTERKYTCGTTDTESSDSNRPAK